jgi:hypothetical protein
LTIGFTLFMLGQATDGSLDTPLSRIIAAVRGVADSSTSDT